MRFALLAFVVLKAPVGNSHVKLPVGEHQTVARLRWIIHINCAEHSRQFVLSTDPRLR